MIDLEELIEERLSELGDDRGNSKSAISFKAIADVPVITFPGLSTTQNLEIQEQIKQVLRISKRENNNNEVAITYDITNSSTENSKYKVVKGDVTSVSLNKDVSTQNLLTLLDNRNQLAVINIHNHPNRSFFPIMDLAFFEKHPSVKIMMVVNTKGEVAFLMRPEFKKYTHTVDAILEAEPNIDKIIKKKKENAGCEEIKLETIIPSPQLRKEILYSSLTSLEEDGVFIQNYVNNETAKNIDFSTYISKYKSVSNNNSQQDIEYMSNIEYLENGEDGYEWEYE